MNTHLSAICDRLYQSGLRFDGRIPQETTDVDGKYILSTGGGWTDSFYVGELYLAYAYTKDPKFLALADGYQPYFTRRAENDPAWCEQNHVLPLDHDTGFLFSLSQVRRYQLTGDAAARENALKAAAVLAGRFHENGQFIRAWDTWPWDDDPRFIEEKKGKMIVDSMMNLALLLWAGEESGNSDFTRIALAHADSVAKHIVRQDGSTFHQFNFDPESGKPLRGCTGQGFADDSCWSRGQAWAVYGFSQMWLRTEEQRYFDTAVRCAKYFIDHLCVTGLPLWDFACRTAPIRPYDASAAAIALSGLCNLTEGCAERWLMEGIETIRTGLTMHCDAMEIGGWESLLLHACVGPAYHGDDMTRMINPKIDGPIIYGDYYYFEALLKLEDKSFIRLLQ